MKTTSTTPLTEKQVLKALKVKDFKHLTKDKFIAFSSMLDKMDPEVAKKAIEQIPEFASTAKDTFSELKDSFDKMINSADESAQSYYRMCEMKIESCQKILEDNDLTFEQKKYIFDQINETKNSASEKDTECKEYNLTAFKILAGVAIALTFAPILIIGLGALADADKQ